MCVTLYKFLTLCRRRLLSSFSSNKKSDDEEVEFVIQEPFTNSTTKMDRHPLSRDASIRK